MSFDLESVRVDETGCCVECGAQGAARDPACETCGGADLVVNDLRLGDYVFDVFITSDGSLGFTVYEPGKPRFDCETPIVDIFVDRDLEVTSI